MGAWSVAILDSGVTDKTEALYCRNKYECDFYYGNANTDGVRSTSHGSTVAKSIEVTNSSLERMDLKTSPNIGRPASGTSPAEHVNTSGCSLSTVKRMQ